MRLVSLKVDNYRSAKSTSLPECDAFNVLIGKNNSGKSTLLSALYGFFKTLEGGSVVSSKPSLGGRLDFHSSSSGEPITVSVRFACSDFERQKLIDSVVNEAPQVRNAVESLPEAMQLEVTLQVLPHSRQMGGCAYVSQIVVAESGEVADRRTLCALSPRAARELADRQGEEQKLLDEHRCVSEALSAMDASDWESFRDELTSGRKVTRVESSRRPFRYFVRRFVTSEGLSRESVEVLERALKEKSTFEDFRRVVGDYLESISDERKALFNRELTEPLVTFSGEERRIPEYVRSLLRDLASIGVHYFQDRREPIGRAEAERLLKLKVMRGGGDDLAKIQETVHTLLGVKIDAFQGESGHSSSASAELDVDDFLVEANGSGIREALRLILDIEFSKPEIVLIEEPEMHLHPAIETSLMEYLKQKSAQCQVFLTTHSTNFIDSGETQSVYLVSKVVGATAVERVDLVQAAEKIPKELGLRLSSLFMFDKVVFVEGASDEKVLREVARVCDVDFNRFNVGFVWMGGAQYKLLCSRTDVGVSSGTGCCNVVCHGTR